MTRPIPLLLAAVFLAAYVADASDAQEIVDQWRYVLRRPDAKWQQPEFDDSAWREGNGGFGTPGTPGARLGTHWGSNNIWLRKEFELESIPNRPGLLVHHDEDAEIYINGEQVAALKEFTTKYFVVPLPAEKRSVLKAGKNVMAVHCRQTQGGQFIDVHLVDADNVPKLPPAKRNTKPFETELITQWGAEVTAENAWTEYPRPQMRREEWTNLNGHWDYAITKADQKEPPTEWDGKILVPFPLESKLSGVQRLLAEDEALWYRRSFEADAKSDYRAAILHFEAVDYRCAIFVNGKSIPIQSGKGDIFEEGVHYHQGGNTPFWVDASTALNLSGKQELIVRVEDDTEEWQLRGKQVINPRGIWYTQVSGIWQTVWLERVPTRSISDLKITTDAAEGTITVRPETIYRDGPIEVVISDEGREVARAKGGKDEFRFAIANPKLWSPDSPHLYDISATLFDEDGDAADRVESYAGIRTVGKTKDADGHWRFTLNGEPIFHWGPLDQGWWPDGLLTPPSDEAMRFEIEWLKEAGFNMIRKHIKVEPRRYYYHCDRLGMMVWQDQVSGGRNPRWTRLQPNPSDAEWPDRDHEQYMIELERMISALENHPSIVSWVPFNEAWGQHRTVEVGNWASQRDPSRLVNVASGGNFWPAGDVVDHHSYPHPSFPFELGAGGRFEDYIKVVGEFGGHGFPVQGHLYDADRRNWGYGDLPKTLEEYKQRYVTSLRMLNDLRGKGIAGAVYTQTTDVEGEINGLMTYDRKVIKIPAKELAELHRILFED